MKTPHYDEDSPTMDFRGLGTESPVVPEYFGRFRVLKEIASGGMGVILKAWDAVLGREVAIKTLRSSAITASEIEKFVTETLIGARLQHSYLVPVHDMGVCADGRPYFIMSLLSGKTLHEILNARPAMQSDLARLLKIFSQVCNAVAFAHAQGVVHLDLKPTNIMVGDFGDVRVLDWGIARPIAVDPRSESQVDEFFGTPAYVSPEQANGESAKIDPRADVFSLGAILCEILTHYPPYRGKNHASILTKARRAILEEAFFALDRCPAEREVIDLAKRCLAAEPDERPRNAKEVAAAVSSYLESDLRRAERDMVRFFDLTLDLFCIASLDGYFRRVNSNFSRILGYTTDELLSRSFLEFVHPDDRDATLAEMGKLSEGLPVVQFRNRYRETNGDYRWFEWTSRSIPEEGVCYAVARDITERVRDL